MKKQYLEYGRTQLALAMAAAVAMMQGAPVAAQTVPVPLASPSTQTMPVVTVVGTTPLTGLGMPLTEIPAAVQIVGAREIEAQHPNTITDYLAQNVTGVTLNSSQCNPYQ